MPVKNRKTPRNGVKVFGRYIVQDPRICHGAMTFRGTRIFVDTVLEQVARGMDWESIVDQWEGHVSKEAIAEAVRLAHEALRHGRVDPVVIAAPE